MPLTTNLVGQTESGAVTVAPEHFASKVLAGAPDVFSTPSLGALVEATAGGWLARHIDEGQMSVGAQIVINHTGATPPLGRLGEESDFGAAAVYLASRASSWVTGHILVVSGGLEGGES